MVTSLAEVTGVQTKSRYLQTHVELKQNVTYLDAVGLKEGVVCAIFEGFLDVVESIWKGYLFSLESSYFDVEIL